MRRFTLLVGLLSGVLAGIEGRADVLTTFQDALQPNTPAAGWDYLYNEGGAIEDPANYTALLPTTDPNIFYDNDGVNGLPGPAPGRYVSIELVAPGLLNAGKPGGHPGLGSGQSGSGGIERFAIAAYTLSVGGHIRIEDSLLTNADRSTDGLDLRVYVNNSSTPNFSGSTPPGQGSTLAFNTDLGSLSAGDTIYVAIGSRVSDLNDTFSLRYSITAVPEPASIALLLAGLTGAFGTRRIALWRRW